MEQLLDMLRYKRPHGSKTEEAFVKHFLLTPYFGRYTLLGPMQNICITVGESDTLFSSHTDTVHWKEGMQEVHFEFDWAWKQDDECLGADDTTGVWMMIQMINANVPGTYIFHRGEERGGIGSMWIANNMKDWLRKFKRAVAFDRKGESSVITRQRGQDCCSDEFAEALSAQLGEDWKPDSTGVFTDTANYTQYISECTNLSVGYYDQHTNKEMQNVGFALELVPKLIELKWDALPAVREAKERPVFFGNFGGSFRPRNSWDWMDDDNDNRDWRRPIRVTPPTKKAQPQTQAVPSLLDTLTLSDEVKILEEHKDYDNYTLEQIAALPVLVMELICEDDPVFAATKVQELADELILSQKAVTDLDNELSAERVYSEQLEQQNRSLFARIRKLERKRTLVSLFRRSEPEAKLSLQGGSNT